MTGTSKSFSLVANTKTTFGWQTHVLVTTCPLLIQVICTLLIVMLGWRFCCLLLSKMMMSIRNFCSLKGLIKQLSFSLSIFSDCGTFVASISTLMMLILFSKNFCLSLKTSSYYYFKVNMVWLTWPVRGCWMADLMVSLMILTNNFGEGIFLDD